MEKEAKFRFKLQMQKAQRPHDGGSDQACSELQKGLLQIHDQQYHHFSSDFCLQL